MDAALPLLLAAVLLAGGFWVAGALLLAGLVAIALATNAPAGAVARVIGAYARKEQEAA